MRIIPNVLNENNEKIQLQTYHTGTCHFYNKIRKVIEDVKIDNNLYNGSKKSLQQTRSSLNTTQYRSVCFP